MVKREYLIGFGAFAALLCLMVVLYSVSKQGGLPAAYPTGSYVQQGSVNQETLTVQVADPQFLPKGTTAFFVTFGNASVYVQGSGWLSGGGYGPVNLEQQGNQSITISAIGVPYNSLISESKVGVKSAYLLINGKRYNASFPGGFISTNMSASRLSGDRVLLVDFSPFALSARSASNSILLGYSSRAYLLLNATSGYAGQTTAVSLQSARLVTPAANVTVRNATISAVNGVTELKLTVVNHSNRTAQIGAVAVVGAENFTHNRAAISTLANGYASEIMQKYQSVQQSNSPQTAGPGGIITSLFNTSPSVSSAGINYQLYTQALSIGTNLTNIVYSNVSALARLAGPIPAALLGGGSGTGVNTTALRAALYQNIYNEFYNESVSQSDFQSNVSSVSFSPSQDGTLEQYSSTNSSYSVPPDASATFNYTGQMALDNATSMSLVPQSSYDVVVAGSDGTSANYTTDSTG
jgi:hypothetical protein